MKTKNNKPTKEEKNLAMSLQGPQPPEANDAMQPKSLFNALLEQPTMDAAQLFGGVTAVWVNPMEEYNELFPEGGDFSKPFFVVRAWTFTSKTATQKDRIGLKLAASDGNIYHVSLPHPYKIEAQTGELEALYADRKIIADHFAMSSTPVGLMQFQKIDRGQSNSYWRLINADAGTIELANVKLPSEADDAAANYLP